MRWTQPTKRNAVIRAFVWFYCDGSITQISSISIYQPLLRMASHPHCLSSKPLPFRPCMAVTLCQVFNRDSNYIKNPFSGGQRTVVSTLVHTTSSLTSHPEEVPQSRNDVAQAPQPWIQLFSVPDQAWLLVSHILGVKMSLLAKASPSAVLQSTGFGWLALRYALSRGPWLDCLGWFTYLSKIKSSQRPSENFQRPSVILFQCNCTLLRVVSV